MGMKTLFAILGLGTISLFNNAIIASTSIPTPYQFSSSTSQVQQVNFNLSTSTANAKSVNQKISKSNTFKNTLATTSKENIVLKTEKKTETKIETSKQRPAQAPVAIPTQNIDYYTNSRGDEVQSPTYYNSAPSGASAQCRDGTYSFSQSRRGTCSHHGGVAEWI